jgi:four helix bundle protein
VDSYKSLRAWQSAHELCIGTLEAVDDSYQPRAQAVFMQLRRAVVSVEANIVEGYALGTTALFRRHLRIALGSAAEAECLLRIAGERGYLSEESTNSLQILMDRSIRSLFGLIRSPRLRKEP